MERREPTQKALVLAGGGARGSYQVGVWRALMELDWHPQIITGTSVGGLPCSCWTCTRPPGICG